MESSKRAGKACAGRAVTRLASPEVIVTKVPHPVKTLPADMSRQEIDFEGAW